MVNNFNDKHLDFFRKKFRNGLPYPHLVIENFLEFSRAKKILQELEKQEFEHKESDLFSFSQTADFSVLHSMILKEFYFFMKSFAKTTEKITSKKLNGRIDIAGSLYESCDYLLCHDDQLDKRQIAFVYYLTDVTNTLKGGDFLMYGSLKKEHVREIKPRFNSLLFFEVSKKSFHAVREVISGERYAIGGWYH